MSLRSLGWGFPCLWLFCSALGYDTTPPLAGSALPYSSTPRLVHSALQPHPSLGPLWPTAPPLAWSTLPYSPTPRLVHSALQPHPSLGPLCPTAPPLAWSTLPYSPTHYAVRIASQLTLVCTVSGCSQAAVASFPASVWSTSFQLYPRSATLCSSMAESLLLNAC